MNLTSDQKMNDACMKVDASGLTCPEPVMMLHNAVRDASPGDLIEVVATDPSTLRDIPRFCSFLEHELVKQEDDGQTYMFWIKKG
ncbi:sulfurtransferase TusA [Teredinibacter haidensis]|uniref:sulfurtransferase TusA n=1 Tax=Teredinibacter haidensis TaxID=2731755 RepID=UPI000B1A26BA|nr:sulfurtransferase TusA [Teredinibacter haidensis]